MIKRTSFWGSFYTQQCEFWESISCPFLLLSSFIWFGYVLNKTADYTPIVYMWCCSVVCTKATGCIRISLDILIIEGIYKKMGTSNMKQVLGTAIS
jgi:hypothetical protein